MDLIDQPEAIPGGAIDALLSRIVEEYEPKTDTFDVTIVLGGEPEKFPFRRITDGKEWEDLQKAAVKYAQSYRPVKAGKMKVTPMSPEMAKWSKGVGPEIFAKVYIITRLALHPAFQSEPGVMMMYRRTWSVFSSVIQQIDLASTNQIADGENVDYDEEGKDSEATTPTA